MIQIVTAVAVVVVCGGLAYCVWVLWSVRRDLRALDSGVPAAPPSEAPTIPDAEIDYDYVTDADLRRMSREQLWRGYEHALRREHASRVVGEPEAPP